MERRRTMIPWQIFTKFSKIPKRCQYKKLLPFVTARETFVNSFPSHGKSVFYWVARSWTTKAYGWLFRDSPSSLRTLWSAVIKSPNFSAWGRAPPSARCPGHFGSQTDFGISVFRKASINTVLPWFWYHFGRTFRIWVLRNVCGCMHFVSSRLSLNSSNHSGRSRKRSSVSRLPSLFLFSFWVFWGWSAPLLWS